MDAPTDIGSPRAAPPPQPPEGRAGPRRLRRRPDDGHVAGVCAGVAEYFNVDPLIVRIAAVVLAFSGPGLVAYVLAWIFVPAESGPARYGVPQPPIDRTDRATQIFGIVLLGLGVSVIWGDWWSPLKGWIFPLGLMALGAWLLLRPDRTDEPPFPPPVPPRPPVPPTPTTSAWSWPTAAAPVVPPGGDPLVDTASVDPTVGSAELDDTAVEGTQPDDPTSVQPTTAGSGGDAGSLGPPPAAPWDVPPSPAPGDGSTRLDGHDRHDRRHRHRHRHLVGPGVFGVLLIWTGVAWLTGVGLTTGLAVGLVILGLGFVLGSFVGGSRALIFPALLVAAALAVFAIIDVPLAGPVGEQYWSPASRAELDEVYEVSMGEGTLDLSEIGVLRADTSVRASVGLGQLVVYVPEDQDLIVNTEVGAGEAVVFDKAQNGVGFDTHDSFPGDGGTLVLDLEVGMGQIEVRRTDVVDAVDPVDSVDSTTTTLGRVVV